MAQSSTTKLELGARHAQVVHDAIKYWVASSTLSESQAAQLADTIVVQGFDWRRFAKYTLRLAVLCFFVAVSSVLLEARFTRLLRRIVELPPWMRGAATAMLALVMHILAYSRAQRQPQQVSANESIHALGAIASALAALQLLEQLYKWFPFPSQTAEEQQARRRIARNARLGVALGLATDYAVVGLVAQSNFIWSCAMIVLGGCAGGMVDYYAGTYAIAIQSPTIFIGLGSLLVGVARLMRSYALSRPLWSTTRTWGLLYVFISLWILSIWGHDRYMAEMMRTARLEGRLTWSVLFFLAAGASTWHGLRWDDGVTKGFGLTFLGINLYTKYFETFWGRSKALVFAGLAGSLALVGWFAEDVWNMRARRA